MLLPVNFLSYPQSPVQAEEERERERVFWIGVTSATPVRPDADQSKELPNCAADDFEHLMSPNTHAHKSSPDSVHGRGHLPIEVPVAFLQSS